MSLNSIDKKQVRKFGLIALIFFGGLFGAGIWFQKLIPTCFFGTLAIIGVGFVLFPHQLKPVYEAWLKIAHFIGRVFTTIMMTLAYYLVITPAALIKRVIGGAPLPLKPDKQLASYWVPREENVQVKEQFFKRY